MARHPMPSTTPQGAKQRRSTATNIFSAALLASCALVALAGLGTALYFQRSQQPAPASSESLPKLAAVPAPEPTIGHPVTIELAPTRTLASAPPPPPVAALPDLAPSAPPSADPPAVASPPTPPALKPQLGATPPASPATVAPAAAPAPAASPPAMPQLAALAPTPPAASAPADPAKPVAEPPLAKPLPAAPPAEAGPAKALASARPPAISSGPGPREPALVQIPAGNFMMGSNEDPSEKPIHPVTIRAFAIAKYPVTLGEWRRCVAANICADIADGVTGNDQSPVTNVSWADAQQYVEWLSKETHRHFRLPTEAEWEYAARGGTQTTYWWGNEPVKEMADCKGCSDSYDPHHPAKVGSFKPNPYGLHDMTGTVAEWVADCWHRDYQGAPSDQAAWNGGDCTTHVLRGGSWQNDITYARASSRDNYDTRVRYPTHGFRLALTE